MRASYSPTSVSRSLRCRAYAYRACKTAESGSPRGALPCSTVPHTIAVDTRYATVLRSMCGLVVMLRVSEGVG